MDHIATENQLHEVIQFYQTNCLELANILIFLQYQRDKNQKRLEQLPDPKDLNLELFLRNNIKDLNFDYSNFVKLKILNLSFNLVENI